jgi:predicted metal-dependent phosphoesterase TrpH
MIRLEFHCHTEYSHDSRVSIDELIHTARRKHIDRVVVTDHNRIDGAFRAKEKAPDMIIVGEEVMTTKGELLAAFVKEAIPRGLSPTEAINMLREQGAFISVSHPFDSMRSGAWNIEELRKIAPLVDAIEVFNSRCWSMEQNRQASEFALTNSLAGTVGSDAHSSYELGRSTLILPAFNNAAELKIAISSARQDVRMSPFWVHFISTWAKWSKKG